MKHKTAYLGVYLSLALICSYVETLIPINFGIPGVKLGLTNIVVLLMLFTVGAKEAITISILRIILSGFMFGNAFSIFYSLGGGILSFIIMLILYKFKLHAISVSVAGGIFHNIGQLIVASIVVSNINMFYYGPVLLVAGAVTGFLIGILSEEIILRLGKKVRFHKEES